MVTHPAASSVDPDPDPFGLARFEQAQAPVWDEVLRELRAGRKATHWMWFVFPQLAVLGRSGMARHFGLSGIAEARAFLEHPLLGTRLVSCCELLLALEGRPAADIFGSIDAMKLRSCMTLFDAAAQPAHASSPGGVFGQVLLRYYGGQADALTTEALAR